MMKKWGCSGWVEAGAPSAPPCPGLYKFQGGLQGIKNMKNLETFIYPVGIGEVKKLIAHIAGVLF
jgi:hypothetical protein